MATTKTPSTDIVQTAEQLVSLTAAALAPTQLDGAYFVTVPPGYSREDITSLVEKAAPTPIRKRGTVVLGNIESLLAYCDDQQCVGTGYIYADPDSRNISAVFNDQRHIGHAGWRDHRAVFNAEYTPEFKLWITNNKQQKSQTEFSEFIEDNFSDLHGTDAELLLNVATTIQATSGINFSSAKRLQDGQTQLLYAEIIDAKAGSDGALRIPQTFTLGVRIFKNGEAYKLTARLKYRLASGSVKFWYELERPERAVEDAFNGYVETVREKSDYTVLIGKP